MRILIAPSRVALSLALALGLLFLFFRGVDSSALGRAFGPPTPCLVGVVVMTGCDLQGARVALGFLLAPLGTCPFPGSFSATVIGFMTGLLVPRAGEVARPT